jgi:hypothetical protein
MTFPFSNKVLINALEKILRQIKQFIFFMAVIVLGGVPNGWAADLFEKLADDVVTVPDFCVETTKLMTWDAVPVAPLHAEFYLPYYLRSSETAWDNKGRADDRVLLREQLFPSFVTAGILRNLDVTVLQGYSIITDKKNTHDDKDTSSRHDHGLTDLAIAPRWRFWENQKKNLSFAYVPVLILGTGERSDDDQPGPSQGYSSLTHTLVMTKNFGHFNTNTTIDYTQPFSRPEKTRDLLAATSANFSIGYQVLPWLQPEVEMHYLQEFLEHNRSAGFFDMTFGAIMPLTSLLRFETGIVQGIAGYNKDRVTTGIFQLAITI